MLSIAICDDDKIILELMSRKIKRILCELEYRVSKIDTYQCSRSFYERLDEMIKYDIIIVDIEMPDINGMDIIKAIYNKNADAVVIVVTSHTEYSYEAIKYNVYRYLRKSRMYTDLNEALKSGIVEAHNRKKTPFLLEEGKNSVTILDRREIMYIERIGRDSIIKMRDGKEYYSKKKVKELIAKDNMKDFVQIANNYAVNINYIKKYDKYEVILTTDKKLPISRRNYQSLVERLLDYMEEL